MHCAAGANDGTIHDSDDEECPTGQRCDLCTGAVCEFDRAMEYGPRNNVDRGVHSGARDDSSACGDADADDDHANQCCGFSAHCLIGAYNRTPGNCRTDTFVASN